MKTTVVRDQVTPIFASRSRILLEIRLGVAALAILEIVLHFWR